MSRQKNECIVKTTDLRNDSSTACPAKADSKNDFKSTRLYHNGTANAIETTVLKLTDTGIDTLNFTQRMIGIEQDKQ